MKKIIALLFLVVLSSCDQNHSNEKFEKKTVENKYSLSVPESMGVTTELNDVASLQLQNQMEDFYVIVIDESRKDFLSIVENKVLNTTPDLDGYFNIISDHFKQVTEKDFKVYDIQKKRINSAKAIVFSMTGNIDNNTVFYRYAIVEGKERYYQIMSWTSARQEKEYTDRMNKIIESFNVEETGYTKGKSHLAKDRTKK
ncbi:hypothetical protein [Flavobacterium defluvii]|uniref:Lipoprotein n=1 Tax=Flavobacterium defluvii TaxID=370979 RepID=A0A1M5V9G0_9FLAO|nr:hypothetical protein [Flavobacterium defluvii]SHH71866.1 hypothetical protein SAMN05443663_11080 [Flavobacterium defluvii]